MRGAVLLSSLAMSFLAACHSSLLSPTPGAIGFEGTIDGWHAGATGGEGPIATWDRFDDPTAISPPAVLGVAKIGHAAEERFNLFWTSQLRFGDGRLSVAVRGNDGVVDQGGGPMWRVQDANNYYVCRFNPLESNYRVYVVEDGVRKQLGTAICDVPTGTWHRVEVEHVGDHIVCWLDGARLLDVHDGTITKAGGVGLWTKADARTSFDDLAVTPADGAPR
ncbi:MAG: family 16 glycoside hydrolase [Planctomycetota bacterium]